MIRNYQSIPSILGNLGGGIKILVLMGFLIVSPFTKLHFQKSMLNEVFNFENEEQDEMELVEKPLSITLQQNGIISKQSLDNNNIKISQLNIDLKNLENKNEAFSPTKKVLYKQNNIKKTLGQEKQQINQIINSNISMYSNKLQDKPSLIYPLTNNDKIEENNQFFLQIPNIDHQILTPPPPSSSATKQGIRKSWIKSKSIIPQNRSNGQEQNNINEENNLTQQSFQRIGSRKNLVKDLIKETILNNSQLYICDSKHDLDNHSHHIASTAQKRPSILTNMLLQQTKKINREKKKEEDQLFEKHFKTTFNPLKISFLQSLLYYIWPFGRFKRTQQQINYSIKKLDYHLDSIYIIKKLLEIDKLKMLLLDEDQIRLFEYLPKPTINLNKIKAMQEEEEEISNQSSIKYDRDDNQQRINILYQDTRNDLKRTTQAFQAFQTIKAKQNLDKIDKRLINFLDPKMADFFNLDTEPIKIQNNHSSFDNENQRHHFQNNVPDNSFTYSQKNLKIETKLGGSQINSIYQSAHLDQYKQRTGAKKESMFKQSTRQNKNHQADSASLHSNLGNNDQRYDEIEEEIHLANSGQKDKHSIRVYSIGSPSKLNRLRSRTIDQIQSRKDTELSQNNIQNSLSQQSMKNPFLDQDAIKSSNLIGISEQNSFTKDSIYEKTSLMNLNQIQSNDNDGKMNAQQQQLQEQSVSSICSNMIADESVYLQSLDLRSIQFQCQNKFFQTICPHTQDILNQ